MGSSSSIATTGQNPGFLATDHRGEELRHLRTGATPTSFAPLNSLIGNFPISEKTEIYSLRLDHKLTNNQQLMLRGSVSPSFISGIEENAANQNLGENSFSRTATQSLHDLAIVGQHTLLIGSNKVNELRFQYARHPVRFANSRALPGATTWR